MERMRGCRVGQCPGSLRACGPFKIPNLNPPRKSGGVLLLNYNVNTPRLIEQRVLGVTT